MSGAVLANTLAQFQASFLATRLNREDHERMKRRKREGARREKRDCRRALRSRGWPVQSPVRWQFAHERRQVKLTLGLMFADKAAGT
jgi:hypothetical protein